MAMVIFQFPDQLHDLTDSMVGFCLNYSGQNGRKSVRFYMIIY